MAKTLSDDTDDEEPLDPAVERVRRKLARLMVGSMGVMVLGLIAVLAVIVYRLAAAPAGLEPGPPGHAVINLPEEATILESDLDGDRILLRLRLPDGTERIVIHDRRSGSLLGDVAITAQPVTD